MHILIAGDGKVGATLARRLSAEGHDITLIDTNARVLEESVERYDVMGVAGNCAALSTLLQAGVRDADLLIAATSADEINLLCCTTAHGANPKLHTIARIRNPEYAEQTYEMRDIFGLSLTVNPEKQAAEEILRLLKYPGFLQRDTFANSHSEIVELRIQAGSKLCNAALSQIGGIVKCRILICAVLRGGTAIAPNGDFVLREGDRIFVTAPSNELTRLLKQLNILSRRVRSVILCGGGRVSHYLAELLLHEGISVRLIERDADRCRILAERLPQACVVQGDGSDQNLLEGEGIAGCDALVTLTGLDELNMVVSLFGSSRGVPQVITKLSRLENRTLVDSLGLGSIVCPKELCCNTIVRYVRAMQNQTGAAVSMHTIADGQIEAMEFQVDASTKNCGVPLKSIRLRANVLLASITHGAHCEIPSGDSVFRQGDTLVVVSSGQGTLRQLNDIFA